MAILQALIKEKTLIESELSELDVSLAKVNKLFCMI